MKKLIIFLSIVIVMLSTSEVHAATSETHSVVVTIDNIFYQPLGNVYEADCARDALGGQWTLDLEQSDTFDAEHLRDLQRDYKGAQVKIVFTGTLDDPDDWEIVSSDFVCDNE